MRGTSFELTEILERISDAFVALDNNLCYTYVNKKAGEILHRNPNDLIGKHLLTEYPEFKNQLLYHAFHKAISEQQYVYLEEFCQPFNAWFENHIYPSAGGLTIFYRDITERKKIEEQLSKSEAQYGILVENIHEALIVEDTDGNLVYANKGFRRIFGYDPDEPLKLTLKDYTSPNSYGEVIMRHINRVNGKPEIEEYEYRGLRKDGTEIWLEARVTTIVENGKITGTRSLERDITERKKAEQLLEEKEHLLSESQRLAHIGSWQTDLSGQMKWTDETYRIYGVSQELYTPTIESFVDLIHPDDRNLMQDWIEKFTSGKQSGELEFRTILPDGTQRWLSGQGELIYNTSNELLFKRGTVQDITERKKVEQALKESEKEFRSLAESMPQIVWATTADGLNTYFNRQWVDYTGLSLEESYGEGWNKPFHPEDKQRAWDAWQNAVENNAEYSLECRLKRYDGTYHWWLIRGVPQLSNTGEILKWYGTCTDIEKIKQTEQQLKLSDEKQRIILQSLLDNIVILNAAGEIQYINHVSPGLNQEEVIGSNWLLWLHEEDRFKAKEAIRHTLYSGELSEIQIRAVGPERKMNWFDVKIVPIPDSIIPHILLVAIDITERKKAEAALRQSEEQYRDLVENITDLICTHGLDGQILSMNKASENILGHNFNSKSNFNIKDVLTPGTKNMFDSYITEILKNGHVQGIMKVQTFNGSIRTLEFSNTLKTEGVDAPVIRGYARDITDQHNAEIKLKESELHYRSLIDQASDAIILTDFNGNFIDVNESACTMLGFSKTELIGMNSTLLIDPEELKVKPFQLKQEEIGKQVFSERRMMHKNGTFIDVEANVKKINDNLVLAIVRDITERKIAERKLFESENRLRVIFETEPECVKLLGPANELLEMNSAGLAMIEADYVDQVRNVCVLKLINENHRDAFAKLTADVFDGKSGTLEFELTGLKGTKRWLETHAVPLKDAHGNVSSLLAVSRDVTERKKSEEALKVSEEKYRFLFERNLAGVYQSKLNGSIFTCNEAFARMLGYDSANELLFQDARQLYFTNSDRNNFISQLSEKGELTNHETKMKKKDGSPIYIIENCSIQMQPSTGEAIIEGMMVDITDRKKAEAEINASQERFRTLYEENPLMNFTLDENGIVLSVNKRGASDLGYHCNELVGTSVLNVFFPEDRQAVLRQIHECVLNPRKSYSWEMRKVTKDGNTIWVSETGTALVDANGNYLVMIVCENITERKKAELEIKHINDQLHNLTTHLENIREEERTNIAREIHDELGQQLTGIKMDLTMLNQSLMPANISIAKRISGVMLMVDDTIKAVRKISTRLRPAVLDDLGLIATLDAHCLEFEKRFNIKCICNCNSLVEEQDFDKSFATGIFRIFQESLTNIARHSKATSIMCDLMQDGNQLVLSIKDNGLGFKIDEMQNKSLGILGMKERAMMMNGKLTIESHEGKGTQILLRAPVRLHTHD